MDGRISELSILNATSLDIAKANAVAADRRTGTRHDQCTQSVTVAHLPQLSSAAIIAGTSTTGPLSGTITGTIAQATHPTIYPRALLTRLSSASTPLPKVMIYLRHGGRVDLLHDRRLDAGQRRHALHGAVYRGRRRAR